MFFPHVIAEAGYRRDAMLADAENHRLARAARRRRRRATATTPQTPGRARGTA